MTSQNPDFIVPDIERAALTMLADGEPGHPLARAYVHALVHDPAEQRFLRDFLAGEPDLPSDDALDQAGYGPRRAVLEYDDPGPWYRVGDPDQESPNQESPIRWRRGEAGWRARLDIAALRLAVEVVAFRRAGRPAGDQVSAIGTPAMRVGYLTTSLAAAVAGYVRDVRSAYGWRRRTEDEDGERGYP